MHDLPVHRLQIAENPVHVRSGGDELGIGIAADGLDGGALLRMDVTTSCAAWVAVRRDRNCPAYWRACSRRRSTRRSWPAATPWNWYRRESRSKPRIGVGVGGSHLQLRRRVQHVAEQNRVRRLADGRNGDRAVARRHNVRDLAGRAGVLTFAMLLDVICVCSCAAASDDLAVFNAAESDMGTFRGGRRRGLVGAPHECGAPVRQKSGVSADLSA